LQSDPGGGRAVAVSSPYSPDFNPIEYAFAKFKALLRKAAEWTVDAHWDRIGALLKELSSTECANFFAAVGYDPV
jgi:transposase